MWSARPVDVVRAGAGCADEVDLRHQDARAVLLAEQDDARHEEIERGGAEAAGPAHGRARIVADADEIDVGLAVDLPAAEEEGVDATLCRTVEELAPAVGEEVVVLAAQQRYAQPSARARPRQQRCG